METSVDFFSLICKRWLTAFDQVRRRKVTETRWVDCDEQSDASCKQILLNVLGKDFQSIAGCGRILEVNMELRTGIQTAYKDVYGEKLRQTPLKSAMDGESTGNEGLCSTPNGCASLAVKKWRLSMMDTSMEWFLYSINVLLICEYLK